MNWQHKKCRRITLPQQFPSYVAILALIMSVMVFLHTLLIFSPAQHFSLTSFYLVSNHADLSSRSSSCHLPNLNPWDPTILPYVSKVPPLVCSSSSEVTILQNPETGDLHLEDKPGNHSVQCSIRQIKRGSDDFTLEYGEVHQITSFPLKWPNRVEIVELSCLIDGQTYKDVFAKLVPISRSTNGNNQSKRSWNVLIVGIDSISNLNFARSLPKSLEKLNEAGVIIFKGYNKVGENTFPNLVPLLTGRRVELLPGERLVELPHDGSNGETFDDYPFIWKQFKDAGYVTMYTEDMPRIGTFHWQKNGFRKQPTDHYGRTLFYAMDELHPFSSILNPVLQMFEANNIQLTASPSLCFQGRKKHNIFWNYAVKDFVNAYLHKEQPFFGLTWLGEPSHDHVNMISVCDDDLSELIDWLNARKTNAGENDNTFVFVMSDHGARFDNIRNTLVGRIEDRMPFLSVWLPNAFKNAYPQLVENLKRNSELLVTPLDLYQTFQQILHLSRSDLFPKNVEAQRKYEDGKWAASLFSEMSERSCWQANIPEHYCACYIETPVSQPNESIIINAAGNYIIQTVNNAMENVYKSVTNLSDGTTCAKLSLDTVESASRIAAGQSVIHDVQRSRFGGWIQPGRQVRDGVNPSNDDDYVIVARAKPSNALFEAHIRHHNTNEDHSQHSATKASTFPTDSAANEWIIVGEIQRINAYANQSWCISGSSTAKKFCFCTNEP